MGDARGTLSGCSLTRLSGNDIPASAIRSRPFRVAEAHWPNKWHCPIAQSTAQRPWPALPGKATALSSSCKTGKRTHSGPLRERAIQDAGEIPPVMAGNYSRLTKRRGGGSRGPQHPSPEILRWPCHLRRKLPALRHRVRAMGVRRNQRSHRARHRWHANEEPRRISSLPTASTDRTCLRGPTVRATKKRGYTTTLFPAGARGNCSFPTTFHGRTFSVEELQIIQTRTTDYAPLGRSELTCILSDLSRWIGGAPRAG